MQKLVFENADGDELDLTSGNFGVTKWAGLSNTTINVQTQKVPFNDGSVFLDALLNDRELSFTVAVSDGGDLGLRYELRRMLISALNPKLGEGYLYYTNDHLSRRIKVLPQLPIFENKNINTKGSLKASVTFTACSPYWEDVEESIAHFVIGEAPVIVNNGDVPTQIKIDFFGDAENPTIENLTTGAKVSVQGGVGDDLAIDTNFGEKSVEKYTFKFKTISNWNSLYNVCYSESLGLFVAVGTGREIITSKDGVNWSSLTLPYGYNLYDVTYVESVGLFVAVGAVGTILTSTDGITWTSQSSGLGNVILNSVCYSESLGLFVALGGTVVTSTDGITWTSRTSGTANGLTAVCYSESLGLFVAVGASGTLVTSADGITWTVRTSFTYRMLYGVAFSESLGLFVAVGDYATAFTSTDGINWTELTMQPTAGRLSSVTFDNGKFVIASTYGRVVTSSDGENWTYYIIEASANLKSAIWCGELGAYIAVDNRGNIYRSADGTTWTNQKQVIQSGNKVAYSKTLKLFCMIYGANIYTGTDGINWTNQTSGTTNQLYDLKYIDTLDLFVAVGASGTILTSVDGENWTTRTSGVETALYTVEYAKTRSMLIVGGASGEFLTSTNAETWTKPSLTTELSFTIRSFAEDTTGGANMIVAVGSDGAIFTTTQEAMLYWTSQSSGTSEALENVIYAESLGLFVAVGTGGTILTSADGVNWTSQTSGTDYELTYIISSEDFGLLVAIGAYGTLLTSTDGVNWGSNDTATNSKFMGGIYISDKKLFEIVGGAIVQSEIITPINMIAYITSDSDLGLNLQKGENQFILKRKAGTGSLRARITYRQKYIGV